MRFLNRVLNLLSGLVFEPWRFASPWVALAVVSVLTAGLMVWLFHLSSNQAAVRTSRNRLLARTLELLLFRHDMAVTLSACGRLLLADLKYLATLLRPMLVGAIPLTLAFVQTAGWLEWRPLAVGETVVLEATLDPAHAVMQSAVTLDLPECVRLDSEPVRVPSTNTISWRLKAVQPDDAALQIHAAGTVESKSIAVGSGLAAVSPQRPRSGFWNEFWSPTETPLAASGPVVRIDLHYPARRLFVGLHEVHWTAAAIVLMMAFGLAFGRILGVRLA